MHGPVNLRALLCSGWLRTLPFYWVLPTSRICRALSGNSFQPGAVGCGRRAERHMKGSIHWSKWQKGTEVSKVPCIDFHLTPLLERSAAPRSSTTGAFLAQFPCQMPRWGRGSHCTGKGRTLPHIVWQPASPFSAPQSLHLPKESPPPTPHRSSMCGKIYPFLIDCTFIVCVFSCSVMSNSLQLHGL